MTIVTIVLDLVLFGNIDYVTRSGRRKAQGSVGPWVASTPTRTVSALMPSAANPQVQAEAQAAAEEKTVNPAVKDQLLSLKQTLADKGVQDEEILSKLAALEKTQEIPSEVPQALSHRTVNQLQKAEKVYESTKKQIQELDKQWASFKDYIQEKYTEQAALYKNKRKMLVDKNQETVVKIKELNAEIQKAAIKQEVVEVPDDLHKEPSIAAFDVDLTGLTDTDEEMENMERTNKSKAPQAAVESSPAKVAKTS